MQLRSKPSGAVGSADTQPSQILHDVLDASSSEESTRTDSQAVQKSVATQADAILAVHNRNAIPNYHFHGLAETQSHDGTGGDGDIEMGDDSEAAHRSRSMKENILLAEMTSPADVVCRASQPKSESISNAPADVGAVILKIPATIPSCRPSTLASVAQRSHSPWKTHPFATPSPVKVSPIVVVDESNTASGSLSSPGKKSVEASAQDTGSLESQTSVSNSAEPRDAFCPSLPKNLQTSSRNVPQPANSYKTSVESRNKLLSKIKVSMDPANSQASSNEQWPPSSSEAPSSTYGSLLDVNAGDGVDEATQQDVPTQHDSDAPDVPTQPDSQETPTEHSQAVSDLSEITTEPASQEVPSSSGMPAAPIVGTSAVSGAASVVSSATATSRSLFAAMTGDKRRKYEKLVIEREQRQQQQRDRQALHGDQPHQLASRLAPDGTSIVSATPYTSAPQTPTTSTSLSRRSLLNHLPLDKQERYMRLVRNAQSISPLSNPAAKTEPGLPHNDTSAEAGSSNGPSQSIPSGQASSSYQAMPPPPPPSRPPFTNAQIFPSMGRPSPTADAGCSSLRVETSSVAMDVSSTGVAPASPLTACESVSEDEPSGLATITRALSLSQEDVDRGVKMAPEAIAQQSVSIQQRRTRSARRARQEPRDDDEVVPDSEPSREAARQAATDDSSAEGEDVKMKSPSPEVIPRASRRKDKGVPALGRPLNTRHDLRSHGHTEEEIVPESEVESEDELNIGSTRAAPSSTPAIIHEKNSGNLRNKRKGKARADSGKASKTNKPLVKPEKRKGKQAAAPPTRTPAHNLRNRRVMGKYKESSSSETEEPLSKRLAETHTTGRKKRRVEQGEHGREEDTGIDEEYASDPHEGKRKRGSSMRIKSEPSSRVTRVMGLWKKDGCYYPATVVSYFSSAELYGVKFDDGDSAQLKIDQMRALRLAPDDEVILANGGCSAVVSEQPPGDQPNDVVKFDIRSAPISHIRIPAKQIMYRWRQRTLQHADIVTLKGPQSSASLAPRSSTCVESAITKPAVPCLRGYGILVTETEEKEKEKAVIKELVSKCGATIVDWDALTAVDVEESNGYVEYSGLRLRDSLPCERLFLVSSAMCTTPKFCIALALGVPCVSMSWLEACFNQARRVEWLPYLLPRGVSNVLHITLSQQVDIDWGDCKEDLDQLLSRPYVTKYFEGKAIALVVRDVRKYASGAAQRALMPMPRILLSMGAGSVVVPLGAFDTILYKKYDWVVFEDETKVPSSSRNAVSWDWVKECLIANRILPV